MNIFVFCPYLKDSADYFFDKDPLRARKQIVELAQCLATVLHERGLSVPKSDGSPYRPTHPNHPVVRWLRSAPENAHWASAYLWELLGAYCRHSGKTHGCASAWQEIWHKLPKTDRPCTPVVHGVRAHEIQAALGGDVYDTYRTYLQEKLSSSSQKFR
jgi:hypothetical protein